jgi:microcystin-dependent protein
MEAFIGQIQLFAFGWEPPGWRFCDGATLKINDYQAVFSLMGTTYGGDGQTTFALPDLIGKEPIPGSQYCICIQGIFPSRQ